MGCPVEIWVPLMAAGAPFARTVRDRFRTMFSKPEDAAAPLEMHHWAPVGSPPVSAEAEQPAS
ncbi:MAG: hypothetical protein EXR68_01200 [Dehalococcoidia bacterium]|nr:hypothetical protein [Dehalococcoidia bacterium]